jgi:hypothetical protein
VVVQQQPVPRRSRSFGEVHLDPLAAQARRAVVPYVLFCLGLSTAVYLVVHQTTTGYMENGLIPAAVTAMMIINFHHYVVDGIIWKRKKPTAPAAPQPA